MVLSEVAVVHGANNAQLRLIYRELGFSPKFPAAQPIFLPSTFEISSLLFLSSRRNTCDDPLIDVFGILLKFFLQFSPLYVCHLIR